MKKFGNLLILGLLFTTTYLYLLSKPDFSAIYINPFLTLSQYFSLIGTALLVVTFVLSTRLKIVENLFGGLDNSYKIHHIVGIFSFIFLLNHHVLLILNSWNKAVSPSLYLLPGDSLSYNYGIFGLYTLIVLIFLTIYAKLPYNIWKLTHQLMGVVLLFAFAHIYNISSDVSTNLLLRYWMLGLISLGIISYVYKVFIYKQFASKYKYKILEIKKLENIYELTLCPIARTMKFSPGQFIFLRINNKKLGNEEHPFSISSSPSDSNIRLSIKVLGDYTEKLSEITVGDSATLYGPYGKFSENFYTEKNVIAIAGGIGITPFLGMLKSKKQYKSGNIFIIYSVRNFGEAPYAQELEQLSVSDKSIGFGLWDSSKRGHLKALDVILNTTDLKGEMVFLCGPNKMMEELTEQFLKIGIPRKNIIYEDFNLK